MLARQSTQTDPVLFWIKQASTVYSNAKHISFARSERGRLVVEEIRGRDWTDCLATRVTIYGLTPEAMYETMVVSDRCARVLDAAETLEVVLPHNPRAKTKRSPPQDYVAITGEPGIDHLRVPTRYSTALPGLCGVCGNIGTWSGRDFVTWNNPKSRGYAHFCSRRILEIAREERWTGFAFHPADLPQPLHGLWDGIDYLGDEWPPQHWYPPDPNTFAGVEDWIAAFDRVGFAAGSFARVMVREHTDWSSQEAIDWLASYVSQHEPGTRRVDSAAKVYWTMWSQHRDLYRYDPAVVEKARRIGHELALMSLSGLRKRYARSQ